MCLMGLIFLMIVHVFDDIVSDVLDVFDYRMSDDCV